MNRAIPALALCAALSLPLLRCSEDPAQRPVDASLDGGGAADALDLARADSLADLGTDGAAGADGAPGDAKVSTPDAKLPPDAAPPKPCTKTLSAGANVGAAAAAAKPGEVICLKAGDYAPFKITVSGAKAAPITFRAAGGAALQARITMKDFTKSQGIKLESADYIVIEGLWVHQVNQGIYVKDSDHVIVQKCKVTEIGQECMRLKHSDFGAFKGNLIKGCGRKTGFNGEGIYVGSGESPGDDTHDALISGNDVSDTTHEGIELKGFTTNCVVEGNHVHDLTVVDGGGIHVSTTETTAPNASGHVVRGNIVHHVKTVTSYQDGNGINFQRGGEVYNNVLYANQHYGLRVDDKRKLKGAVKILHNTIHGNAKGALGLFDGVTPDVRNNLGPPGAKNMAAQASLFVGATAGDYRLKAGAAAVDAGANAGIKVDLLGVSRPQGQGFDLGAYELVVP